VSQAFTAWQASWNQLTNALQGPLVDALGQVSPESRRKLVNQRRRVEAVGAYIRPRDTPGHTDPH
jgi:hypothetical protein